MILKLFFICVFTSLVDFTSVVAASSSSSTGIATLELSADCDQNLDITLMENAPIKTSNMVRVSHSNSNDYLSCRYQYSTTTMKELGKEDMNQPGLIFYPKNIDDVVEVVKFANENSKKIAIRTGGHHYNGGSTTDVSNIQIDLQSTFTEKEYDEEIDEVRFGVSCNLIDLHKWLEDRDMFVPHGYAGHVFLGGHATSGGMGTLCRGFGLFADHIVKIEMIDANGEVKVVTKETDNGDYFYALLGASNGNFGVVTHVTFKPYHNKDYPKSKAIRLVMPYSKDALLKYQTFAQNMARDSEYPGDFDLCVTVFSKDIFADADAINRKFDSFPGDKVPIPMDSIVIFAGWSNLKGIRQSEERALKYFKELKNIAGWFWGNGFVQEVGSLFLSFLRIFNGNIAIDYHKHTKVSEYESSWLFRRNREYRLNYQKFVQYIPTNETVDWATWSTERMDELIREGSCKTLLQTLLIGGKHSQFYKNRMGKTAFSFRNTTVCIGLDIFYNHEIASQKAFADYWQKRNYQEGILDKKLTMFDYRVNSFPNTGQFDMEANKQFYFDDEEKYKKLQKLKKFYDPRGVFSANKARVLP
eukprot:gene8313-11247_t